MSSLASSRRAEERIWGLTAFGLSIRSYLPLLGSTADHVAASGHQVEIKPFAPETNSPSDAGSVPVLEHRLADDSLVTRITRVHDGGYRIEGPGSGTFAVASDGSTIACGALGSPPWRWQRSLFAQALPLAATLQGYELLHASAVAVSGHALAFVAPSGTGKTSLATRLIARGAPPITDDVLSVERKGPMVLAHPGVALANIAREQVELLSPTQRARVGRSIGTSDKVHVEMANMPDGPLPLGAIFFLRRSNSFNRISLERTCPPDPRDLLGATFAPHTVSHARIVTHLHMCAELAASVPVFRLLAPVDVPADALAMAVEREASVLFP